ncbi:MAG: hypothetical protein QOH37_2575, partial [Nocardioidaceae bacterium]|nr:hypothetical protein [Nocardioidaceae bacterium]
MNTSRLTMRGRVVRLGVTATALALAVQACASGSASGRSADDETAT